jgi:hypothetical protein
MGRLLLVSRLIVRDLRRRPVQAVLLLLAITAATTTLSLGLALHGVTSQPYQRTRAETAGPDVVAQFGGPGDAELRQVRALAHDPGVTGHSGPYPIGAAVLRARGITVEVEAEGRDQAPASADQPKLTQGGGWVRNGEVVVERTFAMALDVRAGRAIALNGRPFTVAGVAVTAAVPPYPNVCYIGCDLIVGQSPDTGPGLIWLTQADTRSLATSAAEPLT